MLKHCIACAEEILEEAKLCKHCGTLQDGSNLPNTNKKGSSKKRALVITLVGVAILTAGLTLATIAFQAVEQERLQQELAAEQEAEAAAAAEKAREEFENQEERREEEAEQREREREIRNRQEVVTQIEDSIDELAEEHLELGIIDGAVLSVGCTPVSGFDIENLQQSSTTFSCFVGTEDNGDGTVSGYDYTATMDWLAGSWTYRIGRG